MDQQQHRCVHIKAISNLTDGAAHFHDCCRSLWHLGDAAAGRGRCGSRASRRCHVMGADPWRQFADRPQEADQ